jgi:hypothetical protein
VRRGRDCLLLGRANLQPAHLRRALFRRVRSCQVPLAALALLPRPPSLPPRAVPAVDD